jgi:hypothetical protein
MSAQVKISESRSNKPNASNSTTLIGFRGRTVNVGDLVKVHRNLNNGLWSVTAKTGEYKNKVVAHCSNISIKDVTFVISEAGRARVNRERKKNVHAWCVGTITSFEKNSVVGIKRKQVTYDPYKYGFFYQVDKSPKPFMSLPELHFNGTKAYSS